MVLGGWYDTKQVRILDTTTDTWTQWPDLPYEISFHACIMTEEGVIMSGGLILRGGGMTNKTLLIDPDTGEIETIGSMVIRRWFHKIVKLGGEVIIVGGLSPDADGDYATSTEK